MEKKLPVKMALIAGITSAGIMALIGVRYYFGGGPVAAAERANKTTPPPVLPKPRGLVSPDDMLKFAKRYGDVVNEFSVRRTGRTVEAPPAPPAPPPPVVATTPPVPAVNVATAVATFDRGRLRTRVNIPASDKPTVVDVRVEIRNFNRCGLRHAEIVKRAPVDHPLLAEFKQKIQRLQNAD